MINEIKAYERMIKEAEIEYAEKVGCLREKIDNLTQNLADKIADKFSGRFNTPCKAKLNIDFKLLKLFINYNDDGNGFVDGCSSSSGQWFLRIKANFNPKEKFDECELEEWFKEILADYLKGVENESVWNYDDNNEIQQNSNVRKRK